MARGRPKKPLELQMKHLTQEEKAKKELEEQGITNLNKNQLKNPPSWLRDERALKEWNRLVDDFGDI